MSKRRWPREMVGYIVIEEQGIIHAAYCVGSGGKSVEVRVTGRVEIEGREYELDRVVTIALRAKRLASDPKGDHE